MRRRKRLGSSPDKCSWTKAARYEGYTYRGGPCTTYIEKSGLDPDEPWEVYTLCLYRGIYSHGTQHQYGRGGEYRTLAEAKIAGCTDNALARRELNLVHEREE